MKVWDAIVVGAGPAGCACAYDLATAGKSVLLLDKAAFPRMKACAGGLTMKTVRALRYSVEPVVRETIHDIALEGPERLTVRSRKAICVMTVRQELDAFCLNKIAASCHCRPYAIRIPLPRKIPGPSLVAAQPSSNRPHSANPRR